MQLGTPPEFVILPADDLAQLCQTITQSRVGTTPLMTELIPMLGAYIVGNEYMEIGVSACADYFSRAVLRATAHQSSCDAVRDAVTKVGGCLIDLLREHRVNDNLSYAQSYVPVCFTHGGGLVLRRGPGDAANVKLAPTFVVQH